TDPMTDETTATESTRDTTSAPFGRLALTHGVSLSCLSAAHFTALVFERELPHTAELEWSTPASTLDPVLPHAATTARASRTHSALLELRSVFGASALALVTLRSGRIHAGIAAAEQALVGDIERWLREAFPVLESTERREVPVRFWTCGATGASSVSRMIDVPAFEDIAANYPRAVRRRLEALVDPEFRPSDRGQLILWHGSPGTGKTYAIRALAWEWRGWCELHYMIDPEVFFGQRADYMVDVLLDDEDSLLSELHQPSHGKWRLLVLEDTGELIAADAKERTGQGLSRLLNLVDGMVGQGLRVLVLVTTNEPLRRLHPAVARPGRCAARIEFEPFSADEARTWLAAQGTARACSRMATLADLFAIRDGYEAEPEHIIGFST
ncbi:MAG TPA: AAA family ATPase, partial [Solirubrobacteraceae bacterium]|nr:AAA family ATPase [Solirubrobacteraceae bacterium]